MNVLVFSVMESNPCLWLHLAECCIVANKSTFSDTVHHLYPKTSNGTGDKPSKSILSTVGTGLHRKLAIKTSTPPKRSSASEKSSQLTLEYASQCLKNALKLCGHPEIGERSILSSSPRGNGNSSSTPSSAQASPSKFQRHKTLFLPVTHLGAN